MSFKPDSTYPKSAPLCKRHQFHLDSFFWPSRFRDSKASKSYDGSFYAKSLQTHFNLEMHNFKILNPYAQKIKYLVGDRAVAARSVRPRALIRTETVSYASRFRALKIREKS